MQQIQRWRQRKQGERAAPPAPPVPSSKDSLRVIPLGGLGEIGKNMMALEYGDDIIVIDAGIMFPEEDMLGVDLVLPDISYLLERQEKVRAILITHGHEDHTGALPYVLPRINVPVYAPRLAHGLIQVKLREHHLLRGTQLHVVEPGQRLRLGDFQVEFFRVCHSIPDAMGLAIRTPLGLVVHTGDFKMDHTPVDGIPTDFARLARLAAEGVLLLFSDSTYVEVPGFTPSEAVVSVALDRIIGEAPGRVMVATFASLISRIQQVITAAHKHGRQVAVVGRSMVNNSDMALKMGYLKPPPGTIQPLNKISGLPPAQVVLITTGSQGEPTSALVRIANKEHREIQVQPGDTVVISASPIPGNDIVINRTIDNLLRQGARVLHSRNALVHVHGHAAQEELRLMLGMMRPRYFIPVHGEYRHLVAHAELARSLGVRAENAFVLEDGDILDLTEQGGEIVDRRGYGHIFVVGKRLQDPRSEAFTQRQRLAEDGVVVVVLPRDSKAGLLSGEPEIIFHGFVEATGHEELVAQAVRVVKEALDRGGTPSGDWESASLRVQETLGRFLYNETGQRPSILPVAVEV
jgi:ribonuclease J